MPSHSDLPPSSHMPRGLLASLVVSWLVFFVLGFWGHLELHNSCIDLYSDSM